MAAPRSKQAMRRLGNWFRSDDTGVSSETMAVIFLGATKGHFDAPLDNADFGRCYRLVKKVPAIREAFPRIAKMVPAFAGILREWDELIELFEHDTPISRRSLYDRISTLRKESR